jgi:hypothetical protein
MFSNLPTALTPACPAEAKKKATTPKELDSQLGAWIGGNEAIRADPDTFHAWSSFVRTTVGFAHTVGMAAALAYNEESLRAAMRAPSLYNPVQHGDVYEPAHSHHIQPVLNFRARPGPARKQWQPRAGGSDSTSSPVKPSRGKRRRQATTPDSPQSPRRSGSSHCAIHGQCGHSTADCHTVKALKKQKTDKSDKKEQAAAASSSPWQPGLVRPSSADTIEPSAGAAHRDTHEPVRPPVPWSPPPFDLLASPLRLRTLANVTGADEQRLWHYTLDCMEQQPHANLAELRRVRSWITHGVTLDLRSQPSAIDHSNM